MAHAESDQARLSDGDPGSEPFAARLRRYRAAAGLTQEELAARAGVSVRSVGDLERGAGHRPRTDTVRLLAEALDLSPPGRELFVASARQTLAPLAGDGASARTDHCTAPTASPTPIQAREQPPWSWRLRGGRPRWRAVGSFGALLALATAALWTRRSVAAPAPAPAPVPVVAMTVVGPNQAACCWAKQGAWYADGLHGYPGFAGPTYWTWARGATGAPLSAVRWSFTPPTREAGVGGRVAVDVWVPDNNADARVIYAVTDGRGRSFRRAVDQESPAPGFVHRSPGWVRLGTFDGTRDGRRWGALMVDLTDRAPTDCAAYHYASRTCTVGVAQVRFAYATEAGRT